MPKIDFEKQIWQPITGLQQPTTLKAFEGMNQLNPFAIKDTHATRTKNISTSLFPSLSVRGGFSVYVDRTAEIDGIAVYEGKELHVIAGGVWQVYKAGAWTTVKGSLTAGKKWTFINFQGSFSTMHLIATNGSDPPLKYNGTTVTNLANAPAVADFVATHDNRVYLAEKNTVYYSALRKAEDWNTVNESGSIIVETTDGKEITGIIAGSARLTIFKENSIHELFGTRPDNFTMKTVTENLGCPTGKSAQVIDGVIYFLGNDGVYRYSGGSLPTADFSIPIKEELKKINKPYAKNSVSWAIGRKYYLAVPIGANQVASTIFEYDLDFNTWNIWNFASSVCVPFVQLDGVVYGGNKLGNVMKFDSDTDDGAAISWEWISKPFNIGSLAAKTRLYRMWLVVDIPTGSTMKVHVSGSNNLANPAWTEVLSIAASTDLQQKQVFIPVELVNYNETLRFKLSGTGKATVYEVSKQERVFPMGL